jgi:hypothetical protein
MTIPERLSGYDSVFGQPLESLSLNKNGIPGFLPRACQICQEFATTVGIFRLCGDHSFVQELGVILNFPSASIPPSGGVHDVTGFLKLWLRSLPEPLLTPSIANQYFEPGNPESALEILRHLAPLNRQCLAVLFSTLNTVLQHSAVNQMSLANMAICFTTSLLQNNKDLSSSFKFSEFFSKAREIVNSQGDDFIL